MKPNEIKKAIKKKPLLKTIALVLAVAIIGTVVAVRETYYRNLRPVSASPKSVLVTIPSGATVNEIANNLHNQGVIKASWAFEWYVRNNALREDLKAGTYSLRPNQSVKEIVVIITQGKEATNLVTILPGKRIDQIRDDLINSGFLPEDVDKALNPSLYSSEPALADKPAGANLEGYLYPESFRRDGSTTAGVIVRLSLQEMGKFLTPEIRAGFVRQGLTVHQGVTLASIIEQEVGSADPELDLEDKKKVAQVFLKRLKENIALESDATTDYGAILDGAEPTSNYRSAYNTYQNSGLTPTPVSNVGRNSLQAVAFPAGTDYLYFVTGHDCINRFSHTLAEHEELQRKHGVGCRR